MRLSLGHIVKPDNAWLRTSSGRTALLATGGVLFVLGLLTFILFQTQLLFTESAYVSELQPGLTPRSDGGILLGAFLMATGVGLPLYTLSPRAPRERIRPVLGFVTSTTLLLVLHLTIFVNAFVIPDAQAAAIESSFLFHDSPHAISVASFLLALFTGLLVLGVFLSGLALLRPGAWQDRVLHPRHLDAHRTRLALLWLFVLGIGASFARQFFIYALRGDRFPAGGYLDLNVAVVYYLLGFGLILALLAFSARTALLLWGDLRPTLSLNFRESYQSATRAEAALWGAVFLLNTLLLLAGPTYQPGGQEDRVFAVNSKGVSVFFFLVLGLYALHRWTGHHYLRFLRAHPRVPSAAGWDETAKLVVTVAAVWSVLALIVSFLDPTPLTRLAIRTGTLVLVLPFFAMRLDRDPLRRPRLRGEGAHYILIATAVLSVLSGLMFWGIGNSHDTTYIESQGFRSGQAAWMPYVDAVVRLVGSLLIALPIMFALHHLATRYDARAHPAPLLVAGLALILGMHLFFTINTAAPRSETGQTDVIVGFSVVRLAGYDKVALMIIGAATIGIGYLSSTLITQRAVRQRPASAVTANTGLPKNEKEEERKNAPQTAVQSRIG